MVSLICENEPTKINTSTSKKIVLIISLDIIANRVVCGI